MGGRDHDVILNAVGQSGHNVPVAAQVLHLHNAGRGEVADRRLRIVEGIARRARRRPPACHHLGVADREGKAAWRARCGPVAVLDNAPIGRLRVGRHLARPGRKTHHRREARGVRGGAIQSQVDCRRRARRCRILTRIPSTHFGIGLKRQFRLNPAKRLARIHRHVGVGLTEHAVAAKADHVRHFRQVSLDTRSRSLRAHHQRAGGQLPLEFLALVRRIAQLKRQVAKVTGRHSGRCDGRCAGGGNSGTRTLGIDQRTARAIDGRDPGAIGAQRAEVLGQPEHRVLTGQRDHPSHLHTIGRVGRPLVDNSFRAQNIRATQQIKTIAHHRVSRGPIGQTGAVQVGEVKTVQVT